MSADQKEASDGIKSFYERTMESAKGIESGSALSIPAGELNLRTPPKLPLHEKIPFLTPPREKMQPRTLTDYHKNINILLNGTPTDIANLVKEINAIPALDPFQGLDPELQERLKKEFNFIRFYADPANFRRLERFRMEFKKRHLIHNPMVLPRSPLRHLTAVSAENRANPQAALFRTPTKFPAQSTLMGTPVRPISRTSSIEIASSFRLSPSWALIPKKPIHPPIPRETSVSERKNGSNPTHVPNGMLQFSPTKQRANIAHTDFAPMYHSAATVATVAFTQPPTKSPQRAVSIFERSSAHTAIDTRIDTKIRDEYEKETFDRKTMTELSIPPSPITIKYKSGNGQQNPEGFASPKTLEALKLKMAKKDQALQKALAQRDKLKRELNDIRVNYKRLNDSLQKQIETNHEEMLRNSDLSVRLIQLGVEFDKISLQKIQAQTEKDEMQTQLIALQRQFKAKQSPHKIRIVSPTKLMVNQNRINK